jgi:hypothetical protein
VQLSELELYGTDGRPLRVIDATNPGRYRGNVDVDADKLVDGSTSTKWYDRRASDADGTTIQVRLDAPAVLGSYEFFTAPDRPDRDPVDWRVEMVTSDFDLVWGGRRLDIRPCAVESVDQRTFDASGLLDHRSCDRRSNLQSAEFSRG